MKRLTHPLNPWDGPYPVTVAPGTGDLLFLTASTDAIDDYYVDIDYFTNDGSSWNGPDAWVTMEAEEVKQCEINLYDIVSIVNRSAVVNSTNYVGLDRPASIILKNTGGRTWDRTVVFKDGTECTDCSNITSLEISNITTKVC